MNSIQQRAALQRQIWQIANSVRGAVDVAYPVVPGRKGCGWQGAKVGKVRG